MGSVEYTFIAWTAASKEFELQLCYYVHFRTNTIEKSINPFILPALGLIVSAFLQGGSFGIEYPIKVDIL